MKVSCVSSELTHALPSAKVYLLFILRLKEISVWITNSKISMHCKSNKFKNSNNLNKSLTMKEKKHRIKKNQRHNQPTKLRRKVKMELPSLLL
jgi:hypothetical protein